MASYWPLAVGTALLVSASARWFARRPPVRRTVAAYNDDIVWL